MLDSIPSEVLDIYNHLKRANYEVYFVGGCVRNLLMGTQVSDWDLTTNATPLEIQNIFPDSFNDNSFGTVGVKLENEVKREKNS